VSICLLSIGPSLSLYIYLATFFYHLSELLKFCLIIALYNLNKSKIVKNIYVCVLLLFVAVGNCRMHILFFQFDRCILETLKCALAALTLESS